MRNFSSLLPVLTVLAASYAAAQPAAEPMPCEPVNPRATAEARALLKTICGISGKVILSGQHNFPNTGSRFSDHAAEVTGKYPYVWGSDFGFTRGGKDSMIVRLPGTGAVKMVLRLDASSAARLDVAVNGHALKEKIELPRAQGWIEKRLEIPSEFVVNGNNTVVVGSGNAEFGAWHYWFYRRR